jgi:hypothetical protein
MAVMMLMEWEGVTPDQYEALRKLTNFEGNVAPGGRFHIAGFDGRGIRVCDVWERAEDFQTFTEKRLMPAVQQLGIKGEPKVQILPAHNIFAPGYQR